jgi:hypothetical protein
MPMSRATNRCDGCSQQEISDRLTEVWPETKGVSQQSLSETLPESGEIGKLRISVKTDLDKGHDIKTVATQYAISSTFLLAICDGLSRETGVCQKLSPPTTP